MAKGSVSCEVQGSQEVEDEYTGLVKGSRWGPNGAHCTPTPWAKG